MSMNFDTQIEPMKGVLAYINSTSTTYGAGTAGQVLKSNGANSPLYWDDVESGPSYTASGGITIDGSNDIHHINGLTPATVQAVYPITIDDYGHINSYGDAITIPTISASGNTSAKGISIGSATINGITSTFYAVTLDDTQTLTNKTIDCGTY